MALVTYGLSDSEVEESEGEESSSSVELIGAPQTSQDDGCGQKQLFSSLPQPKRSTGVPAVEEETEDEFLSKKEVPVEKPVRIVLPLLSQFDSDEEEEPREKKAKIIKGSGLFSVLPPPKSTPTSTTTFVPNVLKKRPTATKKPKPVKKPTPKVEDSDDDEDDLKMETFDDETWKQVCGRKKKTVAQPAVVAKTVDEPPVIDAAPETVEPYSGLDNAAFKKLVGSNRARRGNIKLIDLDEEDVQGDKDLWMTKALTDPECKPKYVVENPVNDTCRKKHHITYLAQQAKANEQELQNQWSQSKHSRKQTQAKYGF